MSNYLVVVGNSASLTDQDTWLQSRLTGQSHTVTIIDDGAAIPGNLDTTFHGVIMSNTANILQLSTKYNATSRGVVAFGPYPHTAFTTQASPSNGTSTTAQYVLASNGDAITPTGSGTNVTYATSAVLHTYIDDNGTSLGSGAFKFLTARNDLLARATGVRYESGAMMTASTAAPSRRVRMGFTDFTLLNATGQGWVDNAITWITTALANQTPVANAGSDQNVAAADLVTLDGTGSTDGDGTITTYTWSQVSGTAVTLSSTSVAQPTFTSPASLSGATLVFGLTVTDNQGATSPQDTVTITVAPRASIKVRISGAWVVKPLKTRVGGAWRD
ncbi:MAG TPA: PKD domain-containing protein [Candidatus Saccharimonadales bacterium]|nr:PKD domain-containing protein [Candidatus Saccharimonadales bacterium]